MAIIHELDQPANPQPRYTGPAKPVMRTRKKATVAPSLSAPAAGLRLSDPVGSVELVLFAREYWPVLAGLLLVGECVLCGLIVKFVGCKLVHLISELAGWGLPTHRRRRPGVPHYPRACLGLTPLPVLTLFSFKTPKSTGE